MPIGRDSAARASIDSVRGVPDSLRTPRVRRDSIQSPVARGELPTGVGIGGTYRFVGDTLLASGALTLLDLLERIPGVTGFRSGYVASAQTAAYNGDFRRVRIFRDGIEFDVVDPRNGGVHDLADFPLWQLEELSIEQAAGEVRVHARTRTVRNTTPQTRVDVLTGDDETNVYRGYYGKRFGNGALFQGAFQQLGSGSRNRRTGGGGDAFNPFVRVGWAKRRLSADVFVTRLDRRRNETLDFTTQEAVLPNFVGRRDEGYVRVAYGDPDAGVWVQAVASALRFRNDAPVVGTDTAGASSDTSLSRTQYVLAGGLTRWGVRLSGTGRYRTFAGRSDFSPALRAVFDRRWFGLSALAERAGSDSTRRLDVTARLSPFGRVALLGAASRSESEGTLGGGMRTVARAELGLQLGGTWLSGGRIVRDAGPLAAPIIYEVSGESPVPVQESRATGTVGAVRGRVYKDVFADVHGVVWDAGGAYRPRYQGRGEVRLRSNWLRRFPSGEFGVNLAVFDEYRSEVIVPYAPTGEGSAITRVRLGPNNQLGALLELRLQSAVVSFQVRNALARQFESFPGLRAPRALTIYGVRWEFGN